MTQETEDISSKNIFLENSVAWLRAFKGYEHYSNIVIIRTLDKPAYMLFTFTCQQYGIVIDNQPDIKQTFASIISPPK